MARRLVRNPVYRRVQSALRELVRNGEFAGGEQFLTERQVSQRFGVSRPTANKALAALAAEGVVEFR